MEVSENAGTQKKTLSVFTIILILTFVLAILTHLLPEAKFTEQYVEATEDECYVVSDYGSTDEVIALDNGKCAVKDDKIVDGSGVVGATLSQTLLAPIKGFQDAIDVGIFIFILGGFLRIVNDTGALETGIQVLIKKLKGKELWLIPILMFIFSIGGTTYGMLEETVGFYALLSVTMVAAGMDTLVASAVVLLGAGSGVLGSTVNPFAVGAAISALDGIAVNQGYIILIGVLLWLTTYALSTAFVVAYAKKVISKKGSTFLSLQEQKYMKQTYARKDDKEEVKLTGKQKATLWIFFLTFLLMIISFIPWEEFGIEIFAKGKIMSSIFGETLGNWWFFEAALLFLIVGIIIGIVNKFNEGEIVDKIVAGASDMIGVILVIAVARGVTLLMSDTYLDNYIIVNASEALKNTPKIVFAPLNYLLHVVLSFLVPSSSGLAGLSSPIIGPIASRIGYSVEATIMGMVAANGLVNLFTPTCGAIMGGLKLAGVEFTTWLKWVAKVILCIALVNIIILTAAMILL